MKQKNSFLSEHFSHNSDIFLFLCGIFLLITEIFKQFQIAYRPEFFQNRLWYLPFQLCSIPMYILLVYPWFSKNHFQRILLCFLMCFCLLGGTAAFADTSGMHYPLPVLTIHSFLWHFLLILIGIYAGVLYCRTLPVCPGTSGKNIFSGKLLSVFPVRPFFGASLLYLISCGIAEILNLTLDRYGKINMFYINPHYPMKQIIFCELVPALGTPAVILLYIFSTVLGAFFLFIFWGLVRKFLFRDLHSPV